MKKEFLLLLFLFAFISCEQNDGLDYLALILKICQLRE